jgi:hypothetical protein
MADIVQHELEAMLPELEELLQLELFTDVRISQENLIIILFRQKSS